MFDSFRSTWRTLVSRWNPDHLALALEAVQEDNVFYFSFQVDKIIDTYPADLSALSKLLTLAKRAADNPSFHRDAASIASYILKQRKVLGDADPVIVGAANIAVNLLNVTPDIKERMEEITRLMFESSHTAGAHPQIPMYSLTLENYWVSLVNTYTDPGRTTRPDETPIKFVQGPKNIPQVMVEQIFRDIALLPDPQKALRHLSGSTISNLHTPIVRALSDYYDNKFNNINSLPPAEQFTEALGIMRDFMVEAYHMSIVYMPDELENTVGRRAIEIMYRNIMATESPSWSAGLTKAAARDLKWPEMLEAATKLERFYRSSEPANTPMAIVIGAERPPHQPAQQTTSKKEPIM